MIGIEYKDSIYLHVTTYIFGFSDSPFHNSLFWQLLTTVKRAAQIRSPF